MDEAERILELARSSQALFERQPFREKRRLLNLGDIPELAHAVAGRQLKPGQDVLVSTWIAKTPLFDPQDHAKTAAPKSRRLAV
ncbi:MAG: hypothetical protein WD341_16965 [Tistlia sp.]|uniref:hypothetical protein n=1 Tax=Tistlia sp. TaxID=3057121 RepID=UPI0034A0FD4E